MVLPDHNHIGEGSVHDTLSIRNARLHNLKGISLDIPKSKLVVLTGVSGSGKSTLAFDILNKEGQRQYMESLGLVADSLTRPPVDDIRGLSPTISVGQQLANRSPRSTVGTFTEVYTYLRVLYARIGHRTCSSCGQDVPPMQDVTSLDIWDDEPNGRDPDEAYEGGTTYPCPHCGEPVPELGMAHFSFNKPAGACPTCTGLGTVRKANLSLLVDESKSIAEGAVLQWDMHLIAHYAKAMRAAGERYGFAFDSETPVAQLSPVQRDLLFYGTGSPQFKRRFPDIDSPTTVGQGRFEGVATNILRRHAERGNDARYREKLEKLLIAETCPDCGGTRLRSESRSVTIDGQTIVDLARLPLADLDRWLEELPDVLTAQEWEICGRVVADIRERVRRLVDVGVGYLTMERASPSLSAGEGQRLRLAALLGSGLTGVLYVLDEPTVGLHARDTGRLVQVLRQLRDLGNTVLVVEHDLEVIAAADHVIDMGPGGGKTGGHVVASGPPDVVAACTDSVTGDYLSRRAQITTPALRRMGTGEHLTVCGAREHNLKNLTVSLPLGTFIAVTGVSGSGKSSLMLDILDRAARQRFYGASERPGAHERIEGWEYIDKVVTIDQAPIGRSPRSNAATYTDAFTAIRKAFANTEAAQERGLQARHFSFNVAGGRCERCQGAGELTVNMHMLPDVQVRCPACHGRRFKREVLEVTYRGLDVAAVLDLTIEEALALFEDVPAAKSRLSLMAEVGLGYLQLGQPATTLSGGEAQRVKLAKELGRRAAGRTLYLLDEPTTGLHVADVAHLLVVLQRLVDAGHTVVVIEHNLDVIRCADWVIDLGPEGGERGGYLIAEGPPERVAGVEGSHTGKCLRAAIAEPII